MANDESVFYTYHEGLAKKGPDEVCSFLSDYINTCLSSDVKELHIFSDGCAGQNKNQTLVTFLLALTMTERFTVIHQYFTIWGHSFLPCDRHFAVIKRVFCRHVRIYFSLQYDEIIQNTKKRQPPFHVKSMTGQQIMNFKGWWPTFF
jgi:hypothetical protein